MDNSNLINALNDIGKDTVADVVQQLLSANKVATGDLINSVKYEVLEVANGVMLNIIASDYFKFVDEGRRPGKMPPVKAIIPWVEAKGIRVETRKGIRLTTEQSAFVIARSIGRNGIKPLGIKDKVVSDILNNKRTIIESAYAVDIQEYINKNIFV